MIVGKTNSISVMRITTDSIHPPRYPTNIPIGTPLIRANRMAAPVTFAVTWVARMTRDSMSRPNWSVPNQCSADGGSKPARRLIANG